MTITAINSFVQNLSRKTKTIVIEGTDSLKGYAGMNKKLLLSMMFLLMVFCNVQGQSLNDFISIKLLTTSSGWSSGYYEKMTYSVDNMSPNLILIDNVCIYDYNTPTTIYSNLISVRDLVYPYSNMEYAYENNSGQQVLLERAWVIQVEYYNLSGDRNHYIKRVLKPANNLTNYPLDDISPDYSGIETVELEDIVNSNLYYDLKGNRLYQLCKGIAVIRSKNGKVRKFLMK